MESLRVLIVEDESLIAWSVESALTDAGHVVAGIAASQADAIEFATAEKPDCAVVDVNLGPGDGRVVARALAARGIALLFATGQYQDVRDLSRTGALGCLPKPYCPDDVPAALSAICDHHRGERLVDLPDNMFGLASKTQEPVMPAKSAAQQKAAGAALSAKRGDTPKSKLKGAAKSMERSMSERQLEAFASTKRKGKPQHVAGD